MKWLSVDIDTIEDFELIARAAGIMFVNVNDLHYAFKLFVLPQDTHFPVAYTCTDAAMFKDFEDIKKKFQGISILRGTLENE